MVAVAGPPVPEGFLWGAASAAHQIEGGNVNSNWWELEHRGDGFVVEPSGDACDSYHRFPDDVAIVAELGMNAYRFSVEWARVEPEEGEWSRANLQHYRRIAAECRERGITPIVTFHHFTLPKWLAHDGGWLSGPIVDRFVRYVTRVTEAMGDLVDWVCTINEPSVVVLGSRAADKRKQVRTALVDAHRAAVDAVKAVRPETAVGITLALPKLEAGPGGEERRNEVERATQDHYLERLSGDDFVGVQTYTREIFGPDGQLPPPDGSAITLVGWEVYPEALEASIRRASVVTGGLPVVVTENGIATADDDQRVDFTRRALAGVGRCLADGIDVRGYLHWSLLDDFEWMHGYRPTFGLAAVDRVTFDRTIKRSGIAVGEMARARRFPA